MAQVRYLELPSVHCPILKTAPSLLAIIKYPNSIMQQNITPETITRFEKSNFTLYPIQEIKLYIIEPHFKILVSPLQKSKYINFQNYQTHHTV